jgi:hypothetical protein
MAVIRDFPREHRVAGQIRLLQVEQGMPKLVLDLRHPIRDLRVLRHQRPDEAAGLRIHGEHRGEHGR